MNDSMNALTTKRDGETVNVVDGLFAIADALDGVATQLSLLGNAGAGMLGGGQMGAIEGLAVQIRDGFELLASATDAGD